MGIIIVLRGYRAAVAGFLTAVADKRRSLKPVAGLAFKTLAGLIALRAGAAEPVAEEELLTYVLFPAAKTVDAEVAGIIETAVVPCIHVSMKPDLFGDGSRILTKKFGYLFERQAIIQ